MLVHNLSTKLGGVKKSKETSVEIMGSSIKKTIIDIQNNNIAQWIALNILYLMTDTKEENIRWKNNTKFVDTKKSNWNWKNVKKDRSSAENLQYR